MWARVRALPPHERLRAVLILCNIHKNIPDAKMPKRLRWVFNYAKLVVTMYLVRLSSIVKAAYEDSDTVVIITNRPTPPHFPSCGVWVGFVKTRDGVLDCPAQSYMFVEGKKIGMVHTTDELTIRRSRNVSVSTEEARLLLHLSQSRA